MYIPSDDTFFLADTAQTYRGEAALEVGSGSCTVADVLSRNFRLVIACDVKLESLRYCMEKYPQLFLVCCDAATGISGKFDLIVSNPPYLPGIWEHDQAVYGGISGTEQTLRIAKEASDLLADNGIMLLVASSLSDPGLLLDSLAKIGLTSRVVREKKLFYETLLIVEAR